jgi:hypothetical protein
MRICALQYFFTEVTDTMYGPKLTIYDGQGNLVDSFTRATLPGAEADAEKAGYVFLRKGTPLDEILNRHPDGGYAQE